MKKKTIKSIIITVFAIILSLIIIDLATAKTYKDIEVCLTNDNRYKIIVIDRQFKNHKTYYTKRVKIIDSAGTRLPDFSFRKSLISKKLTIIK